MASGNDRTEPGEDGRGKESADSGEEKDRRTADESVPVSEGLTSPGEGLDDAPQEPPQSQDYA